MVRPTLPDSERRARFVNVRMTDGEFERATEAAAARDLSVSDYVRALVLARRNDKPRRKTKRAKR